jgi:hypothetical protein
MGQKSSSSDGLMLNNHELGCLSNPVLAILMGTLAGDGVRPPVISEQLLLVKLEHADAGSTLADRAG